jgi:hypothetical protein
MMPVSLVGTKQRVWRLPLQRSCSVVCTPQHPGLCEFRCNLLIQAVCIQRDYGCSPQHFAGDTVIMDNLPKVAAVQRRNSGSWSQARLICRPKDSRELNYLANAGYLPPNRNLL